MLQVCNIAFKANGDWSKVKKGGTYNNSKILYRRRTISFD